MNRRLIATVAVGCVGLAAGFGLARLPQDHPRQDHPKSPPAQEGEFQLPPGWTEEDMMACVAAATPGEQHEFLTSAAGEWKGTNKMWMPGSSEPVECESTGTIRSILDGRFATLETSGDMPGMGPFNGFAIYGYDNVAETFQATWVDNMGTTMATGTGERSSDGKTLTWTYTYTCPIAKKPTTWREVVTITGPDSRQIVGYGINPKTGKEEKLMEISLRRTSRATANAQTR